jgi:hypothetical protein
MRPSALQRNEVVVSVLVEILHFDIDSWHALVDSRACIEPVGGRDLGIVSDHATGGQLTGCLEKIKLLRCCWGWSHWRDL